MRIAVTYDNGQVFQHFGRTEQFKLYDVENGLVTVSEVIGNEGLSHHALADLLREKGVDLLICGGIGQGGADALENAGVKLVSGAEGSADEAVRAWLRGELESREANCREHGEEHRPDAGENEPVEEEAPSEEVSGEEEEGDPEDCTSNCGTCPHHCARELMPGKNSGKTVRVHYRGTFNDGTQFDSSYDRGEPLEFVSGAGQMIPGFDRAVLDMEVGDACDIHLMPEEAYGPSHPGMIFTVPVSAMPGAENAQVGQKVWLQTVDGRPIPARVTALEDGNITFDANHEMAGKELNFHIELVEVVE
jgi:FKBP-type peptidyl-prolyl cis-trans isomerase 2/predicted Fe-Mo cluster-binding NifX family protein